MGKYCQLVMGPAGTGKSSYCSAMAEHCTTIGRTVHVVNLDPAAEDFKYSPSIDIRNLISVDDTSDELNLGPNGGLIFCMEFLLNNINWFEDQIGDFALENYRMSFQSLLYDKALKENKGKLSFTGKIVIATSIICLTGIVAYFAYLSLFIWNWSDNNERASKLLNGHIFGGSTKDCEHVKAILELNGVDCDWRFSKCPTSFFFYGGNYPREKNLRAICPDSCRRETNQRILKKLAHLKFPQYVNKDEL